MSTSNERELAEIRSRLATLAERVVRLERKIMGRPLVDVFADEDDLDAEQYLRDSGCRTWLWKRE
jgi:hypothetical protein